MRKIWIRRKFSRSFHKFKTNKNTKSKMNQRYLSPLSSKRKSKTNHSKEILRSVYVKRKQHHMLLNSIILIKKNPRKKIAIAKTWWWIEKDQDHLSARATLWTTIAPSLTCLVSSTILLLRLLLKNARQRLRNSSYKTSLNTMTQPKIFKTTGKRNNADVERTTARTSKYNN